MKEAQHSSRCWELEPKEAVERVVRVEEERDSARHEAAMARLEIEAMSGAQAQVEAELVRVQGVSTATEDARLKVDSERDVAQHALVSAEEAH